MSSDKTDRKDKPILHAEPSQIDLVLEQASAPAISSQSPDLTAQYESPGIIAQKSDPLIGEIIAGRIEIVSQLGSGGMSTVYQGHDIALHRQVAVKILSDKLQQNNASLKRFDVEARATSKLTHQNIVRVFEYGVHVDRPYMVMEYLIGENLSEVLRQKRTLSINESVEIAMKICDALAEAHQQRIVHRDLKPSNIMLVDGDIEKVKLVDFGIARILSDTTFQSVTKTGDVFGSPLYMSPEQCSGLQVDKRSDIYSLGCIMYECLTGQPPHFSATAIATITKHVHDKPLPLKEATLGGTFPEELERILFKMLEKKPDDRYWCVEELKSDLENFSKTGRRLENPFANSASPIGSNFSNDLLINNLRNMQMIDVSSFEKRADESRTWLEKHLGTLVLVLAIALVGIWIYLMTMPSTYQPSPRARKINSAERKRSEEQIAKWKTQNASGQKTQAIVNNELRDLLKIQANAIALNCESGSYTSEGWATLKQFKNLKNLDLAQSNITNADLLNLKNLPLQLLDLSGCFEISGNGLAHLSNVQTLRKLNIDGIDGDDACLSQLNTNIEDLNAGDNEDITSAGVALLSRLKNLSRLELANNGGLDSKVVPILSAMNNLRYLRLTGTSLTPVDVAVIQRNLPHCLIEYYPYLKTPVLTLTPAGKR